MRREAKYTSVRNHYARLIDEGSLTPGDRLPSLEAVGKTHGISHATASKVYSILREEGYISTTPRGTFVARTGDERLYKRLQDALNALEQNARSVQLEVGELGSCIVGPDGAVYWDSTSRTWEVSAENR